ncbi:CopG family transcriptional regulator [Novosphingobium sp. BL-8H]|uniref:CopG family transcriptional regulator n=1 Tax=Novosphingobium sp. BL-8H TaxID=3127640 RepID=UPI0037568715
MKIRQNLYLDRDVTVALDRLAAGTRGNKSRLVNDALKAWIARKGAKEIDDLLKIRLDRLSREIEASRRDIDVVLESLALFIRYQLSVTAPLPEADAAARAVGRDRFEAFIAQVGRQIATGKRTLPQRGSGDAS